MPLTIVGEFSVSEITVTVLVFPTEDKIGNRVFGIYTFKSLQELREFLFREDMYAVAKHLGYKVKRPTQTQFNPLLFGRISIKCIDRYYTHAFEFDTIQQFVRFLEENPPIAKAFGYTKK